MASGSWSSPWLSSFTPSLVYKDFLPNYDNATFSELLGHLYFHIAYHSHRPYRKWHLTPMMTSWQVSWKSLATWNICAHLDHNNTTTFLDSTPYPSTDSTDSTDSWIWASDAWQ